MRSLLAIKPKNENNLFSQTFRQYKTKEILFVSPSLTMFPRTQSTFQFNSPNHSSLKSSFNPSKSPKDKSLIKTVYLSYLNHRSNSFQDIKAPRVHPKAFHFRPTAFVMPKKKTNHKMHSDSMPLSFREPSTTTSFNKSFEKHHNKLTDWNTVVQYFTEADTQMLTKGFKVSGLQLNNRQQPKQKRKFPKKNFNNLVIHNIYFQGLMTDNRGLDSNENDLCRVYKEEYKHLNLNSFKRKGLETSKHWHNGFNKTTQTEFKKPNANVYTQTAGKNKAIEQCDNENRNSLLFKPNDKAVKLHDDKSQGNGSHMTNYVGELMEESCQMIQPTKNEKMKEKSDKKLMPKPKKETIEILNENESDNSLNQDLLNEYMDLNTNIQEQLINTHFKKNKTHGNFWKTSLDKHLDSNIDSKDKATSSIKKASAEGKTNKKFNAEYKAITDFLGISSTNTAHIKRTTSGFVLNTNHKNVPTKKETKFIGELMKTKKSLITNILFQRIKEKAKLEKGSSNAIITSLLTPTVQHAFKNDKKLNLFK